MMKKTLKASLFLRIGGAILILVSFACLRQRDSVDKVFSFAEARPCENRIERETFDFSKVRSTLLETPVPSNHSSSIVEVPDGRLLTVWYGGTREGAKDVRVYGERIAPESLEVGATEIVCAPSDVAKDLLRSIRKVGNPVVYSQGKRLWMFVVSVSYGGWSGSAISCRYSDDNGKSWSKFRRLRTSPFFNMSALIRTPCVSQADGGFLLPVYCEFATKYGMTLAFDRDGRMFGRSRIPIDGNRESLQPCVVPLSSDVAVSFARTPEGKTGTSKSTDGGRTWRAAPQSTMENYNASVAALATPSGRVFLVANAEEDRSRLSLFETSSELLTADAAQSERWTFLCDLENEPNSEFSYPFFAQTEGGSIYLTYTYKRQTIKLVDLTDCVYEE